MYYTNKKKLTLLDPIEYGLSSRTLLAQDSKKHIFILKDRKSRIIMKDGLQILEQAKQIKKHNKKVEIGLATTAQVCGKTIKLLTGYGISIFNLEK